MKHLVVVVVLCYTDLLVVLKLRMHGA